LNNFNQKKKKKKKKKSAVVMGRSDIVGMPVFQLLQKAGATVTLCHTQTVDLEKYTTNADILIVAAGQPQMIGAKVFYFLYLVEISFLFYVKLKNHIFFLIY
jgi:5,10-methylene-tetrahydrofolate dehydrogenase/methenyl tetrahydrofolate cyclohydrolase